MPEPSLLPALAGMLSIAVLPVASPALATGVETDVVRVIERMTSAFAAKDVDTVLSTYEANAVVVGEPGQPASGTPALRALFESFIAVDPHFTYHGHEVIEAGDIALHLMPWSMTGKAPDGTVIEDGGLSVAVLRRQPDGRWLMVIDDPYGDHLMKR